MRLEGLHIAEQPGWGALDRKTFIYGEGRGGRKDNIGGQRKRFEGKALKGTRGKRKDFTSEKDAIKARVKSIKASRGGRGKKKKDTKSRDRGVMWRRQRGSRSIQKPRQATARDKGPDLHLFLRVLCIRGKWRILDNP